VAGELWLLETRIVLAPIVLGQVLDPLAVHPAGQQPGADRRVDDHADPLALGEGQNLLLDLAGEQGVLRLQRLHRRDLLDSAQLPGVEVRHADVTDKSLLLQLSEGRPALLDVLVGDRPVDLVEVDRVDAQPLQARMRLAQDRVAFQAVRDPLSRALEQRCLGEHVRALSESLDRAADDLLGVAEAVGGGGVDPVDAELERAVDRLDRLLVILRAPAELPATAADRPGAEANAGDLQTGVPQLSRLEPCLLHDFSLLGVVHRN
jgi:hypothetical protein